MTRLATVAYHKRNLFIIIWTQENCGKRKKFTTAGKRMIHCAGMAWLRRVVVRKDGTRAKFER
jgi:hypothetical protein